MKEAKLEKIFYKGMSDEKFKYVAVVNGHSFDYFTGIAWIEFKKTEENKDRLKIMSYSEVAELNKTRSGKNQLSAWKKVYRREPSELDVLHSLYLDKQCGDMSFQNFCDEFGYNYDSISHLPLHRQC